MSLPCLPCHAMPALPSMAAPAYAACLPALVARDPCCSPCSPDWPRLLLPLHSSHSSHLPAYLPCLQRLTELRDRLFCVADTNAAAMEREVRGHQRPAACSVFGIKKGSCLLLCGRLASNHPEPLFACGITCPPAIVACCRRMPTGGAQGSRCWPSASRRPTFMSRVGGVGGMGGMVERWRRDDCCNTTQRRAMQHTVFPSASPSPAGTFYNDLRQPGAADYSEAVRQYNRCGTHPAVLQACRRGAASSRPAPSLPHLHH